VASDSGEDVETVDIEARLLASDESTVSNSDNDGRRQTKSGTIAAAAATTLPDTPSAGVDGVEDAGQSDDDEYRTDPESDVVDIADDLERRSRIYGEDNDSSRGGGGGNKTATNWADMSSDDDS
jgi:hypothetical protein